MLSQTWGVQKYLKLFDGILLLLFLDQLYRIRYRYNNMKIIWNNVWMSCFVSRLRQVKMYKHLNEKKRFLQKMYCRPDNLSVNCRLGNKTYTGTISQLFVYSAIFRSLFKPLLFWNYILPKFVQFSNYVSIY